jgi:CubicO group peptidase (beta-lactamase class C family)
VQSATVSDGRFAFSLDAVIDKAIAERRIVGTVVVVVRGGNEIYAQAAGFADREAGKPTALETIFRWASLTKVVVATATMALAERGLLSLDDPVTRFLPDFRPALSTGEMPVITLRHLITHTAGLTYGMFEPGDGPYHRADVSDGMDQPGLSIEENLERVASVPLSRAPGTGWGYSIATDILGAAIARAATTSLPTLVEKLVTGPLGMRDSGFVVAARDRLATPYGNESPEPKRMGMHHSVPFNGGSISFVPDRMFEPGSYPSGGGGMSGTASDFVRLLEALRSGCDRVLSPRSIELLGTYDPDGFETFMPGWKWPLGWSVLADPAKSGTPQSPGTWLWGGVYGCSWFVDHAHELTVVVLTNTAVSGMMGSFPDAIRDAIYTSLAEPASHTGEPR